MALNATWHSKNRMPPKATREQRIAWHARHTLACVCRKPPESIADEVNRAMMKKT